MFCPVCAGEYRPGFTECADCGVPLVDEPPAAAAEEEDDDPHRLVSVCASTDGALLKAALVRLDDMGIPSQPGLREYFDHRSDPLRQPLQIRVARGRREEAERCLTDLEASVAAERREIERHGFRSDPGDPGDRGDSGDRGDREDEASEREVLYCPRCASAHRGFSRCVDCGDRLVAEPPGHAEAMPVPVLATLDVEALAMARRALLAAGIPFDWGRLTPATSAYHGEPPSSPLVAAGYIYVPAARETEARKVLSLLHPLGQRLEPDEEWADARDALAGELEDQEESDGDGPAGGREPGLYCPRCGGEYRAGFSRCADCGVPLVETLPPPPTDRRILDLEPIAYRCAGCGGALPGATAICPRCSPPDEDE
jgi:hypothetical protein